MSEKQSSVESDKKWRRDKEKMPNNGSKYKLVLHPRTFSSGEDLLINPVINQKEGAVEKIKIGDIVEIFAPEDEG